MQISAEIQALQHMGKEGGYIVDVQVGVVFLGGD